MKITIIATTLATSFLGFAAVGCATTTPPQELVDARAAYTTASTGPAAKQSPAALHEAKSALDRAEGAFVDNGDSPSTKDLSYIATRKAQLADASARTTMALKAKEQAETDMMKAQSDSLQSARSDLASTQQNLSKTQEQLDREKAARAEAEKKAAMALADLQRIASVKQETRGMVITLSGSVLFETDKAVLLPGAVVKVNEVGDALLKGNPDANITIEGHTDSQGAKAHNMDLSQRRAEAVKTQLVSHGVAADRIKTVGVGPDRPVADNKSPEGRANNRRVEIVVEGGGANGAGGSGPSSTSPQR